MGRDIKTNSISVAQITKQFIKLFVVYVSFVFSATLVAEENNSIATQQLLNDMSRAMRELSYDGVFIYKRGEESIESMRLIHRSGNDGERERLVSLTGPAREVIRTNESVTCIFPDSKAVLVEKKKSKKMIHSLPDSFEAISPYYSFSTETKTSRIAGSQARIANIKPKDKFRHGYKFWIDEDTSLLLKSELRDDEGIVLEQIMFTQLDLNDSISEEMLVSSLTGKNYAWQENTSDERTLAENNWKLTWMPDGFVLKGYQGKIGEVGRETIDHLVYTDGIATVSVFIEKLEKAQTTTTGSSRKGGINTYVKYEDGYQVIVVGEVPQITVQRMANSIITVN